MFCRPVPRRTIALALASLAPCIAAFAADGARFAPNEFEAIRCMAGRWVEYERLPSVSNEINAEDEAAFTEAWADAGTAAARVESAWTHAFKDDPLLDRASECLNRYHDLQWQYDTLRTQIRRRFGREQFRQWEKSSQSWIDSNGSPWLDLQDVGLVRLFLWWGELFHSQGEVPERANTATGYRWLTKPDGWLAPWIVAVTQADGANIDPGEPLTEDRAIEIYRAVIEHQREQVQEQHQRLTETLDLPAALCAYLELRQEAEAMHTFGYDYLRVNLVRYDEIATAEAQFKRAMKRVTSLRPYALIALENVHVQQWFEHVKQREQQLAKLYGILSVESARADPLLK